MPVSVMALLPQGRFLDADFESLRRVLPARAEAAIYGLDDFFLRIDLLGSRDAIVTPSSDLGPPPSTRLLMIEVDADDPTPERTANALLDRLDESAEPVGSAALESRQHLELQPGASSPSAHAFIMNTRQPRLTRDEFYWYYRVNHTSLAKDLQPGFTRYATHRVLHSRGHGFEDGVTVQEYPDLAAFRRHIEVRTRADDVAFHDIANFVGVVDYWVGEGRVQL